MKIKLLKEWVNGEETFKPDPYQILEVPDDAAKKLIEDGIAEEHKAKADDTAIKVDTEEDVDKKINDALDVKLEALKVEKKIPAQVKDEGSGFKSFGEFANCVVQGKTSQQLMSYCKSTGMNIAINADGGFLIPLEYSTAILTAMAETGVLAPKCQNFPANNNLALPFVNITTQATSWTGGATVYKPAEGVAKTASVPQFGKAELHLHKMAAVIYATDELLSDSPMALETFLTTMVSTEFALTKDEDIINGSGAGEALGILTAPCTISVAKETAQPATTIVYENVAKMWSRLYNPSRNKAVWLIAQDAMEQISKLSIAVGTGGAGVFVVNATTAMPQTIFGRPIIWSPHCQTVGTKGDIYLADFSQYITISKAGAAMDTATSIHLKFLEDETAFRFVVRFDGQPWWASAITPKHGSSTVSPFITLDVRA